MTAAMELPRSTNDVSAALMPRENRGDFLSQQFDNPVASTALMGDRDTATARVLKERIEMANGTHYEVTSTLAKDRSIDIGIIATAAWLTHDKGLNEDRARRAAKLGIDTVFISPQQNLTRRGHFGKSVCNIIAIADYLHQRHGRDPDNLWLDGISRGGMHALGVAAKAPYSGDKHAIYSDITVPCFPDGVDLVRDVQKVPHLLLNETGATTAFLKLPLATALHHPRTLAVHPRMLFQHAKEVPTLLSGAVGDAARNLPPDTFMHVTNYLGDVMGQGRRWEPIFEQYDNITVENFQGGGHLSLAAPRCQEKWQERLETVHELLAHEPMITKLGASALCEAARCSSRAFRHRPIED